MCIRDRLYVSHDRYFINRTATRILELTGETLVNYIGNYDYYLEKKEELTKAYVPSANAAASAGASGSGEPEQPAMSAAQQDWKAQKEAQARQRKKENDLKKLEEKIAALEARDRAIDEEFNLPETGTDLPRCQALSREKAEIAEELEGLYEEWELLAE